MNKKIRSIVRGKKCRTMSGINKHIVMGRLGQDPETRQIGESSVTNFSVATSDEWKDKEGEKQERTEWHRIVCWGKSGETIAKFFKKGDGIYLEGKTQTRSWEDKDGNKRYSTETVCTSWAFIPGKKDGESRSDSSSRNDGPPPDFGGGSSDSDIPF